MTEQVMPSLWFQRRLDYATHGRGCVNVSSEVADIVERSSINTGLCHVFIHHTSASLMLCENADPGVLQDLETWMARVVPDADVDYVHIAEGADDMPAHVRSILTGSELTIPVVNGALALGTWQGIFLFEHRTRGHQRHLTVTVNGVRD